MCVSRIRQIQYTLHCSFCRSRTFVVWRTDLCNMKKTNIVVRYSKNCRMWIFLIHLRRSIQPNLRMSLPYRFFFSASETSLFYLAVEAVKVCLSYSLCASRAKIRLVGRLPRLFSLDTRLVCVLEQKPGGWIIHCSVFNILDRRLRILSDVCLVARAVFRPIYEDTWLISKSFLQMIDTYCAIFVDWSRGWLSGGRSSFIPLAGKPSVSCLVAWKM